MRKIDAISIARKAAGSLCHNVESSYDEGAGRGMVRLYFSPSVPASLIPRAVDAAQKALDAAATSGAAWTVKWTTLL